MQNTSGTYHLLAYFNLPKIRQFWLPLLGTIVEYYDYALYGFTAALLSQLYFPASDPTVSLLKTYLVFALGSLAKPLGALIFGWIGDKYGRKEALRWTMLGIFIPTTVIGLIPTYESWGITSTIILILCRLAQGIFLSGEVDGARIFLFETYLKDRPTLINCLLGLCCYLGIFLASLALTFVSQYDLTALWRYPFLIGGVLGGLIFISRQYLRESTDYETYRKIEKSVPLRPDFPMNAFLGTILLCGAVGGLYQLFFVYLGTFTSSVLNFIKPAEGQFLMSLMLLTHIPSQLLAAWLSDTFSPQKVIYWGLCGTVPLLIGGAFVFKIGIVPIALLLALTIPLAFIFTPGFSLILPKVQVGSRYRFVSLGHAIGSVLFSGCAPAISLFFWIQTNIVFIPFLHGLFLCGCVYGALQLLKPHETV